MADFEPALEITLRNEGGFYHNPSTGEIVNHGITLKFIQSSGYKPDADEEWIKNLSVEEASAIYKKYFWDAYHIGGITYQPLANKVFDLCVNLGPKAITLLQATLLQVTLSSSNPTLAIDGILGLHSLHLINTFGLPADLLTAYKFSAANYYKQIASMHPVLASNLDGWLKRLDL